ncbi:MAG TPA: chemotaxis protein CheD [Spirochaetota bacterium]|nr:chemotaxis protein CheD [Spirochaetota bacterium]
MSTEPQRGHKKLRAVIHAGEWYASREPTAVYTLLGSCVAVCLFDPASRIGGMNHILLPGKPDFVHYDDSTRYGINAMDVLVARLIALGANRLQLKAKAFGGGHVLATVSRGRGTGQQNIDFVRTWLTTEHIPIISEDLGGYDTRRIWFHTDTGEVFLKRSHMAQAAAMAEQQEQKALERIRREVSRPGDITLFE